MPYGYCEDYPCCGHTDLDPCPGRGSVGMTADDYLAMGYDPMDDEEYEA